MAYYERKILLPYLQNLSSIELLYQRFLREYHQASRNEATTRESLQNINKTKKPISPPKAKSRFRPFIIFIILFAAYTAFCKSVGPHVDDVTYTALQALYLVLILIFCGMMWFSFFDVGGFQSRNKLEIKKYKEALALYEENQKQLPALRYAEEKQHEATVSAKKRLDEVSQLRQTLYNVNIIPNRYRNVRVACYLYDYFNTSHENDLDKILQTMLLDEINQKMDKVLVKLEDIIINQRYQIALQEKQNHMIQRNHEEEMRSLAKLAKNQELQSEYLQMIETNTSVTSFFTTANYFQTSDFIRRNSR